MFDFSVSGTSRWTPAVTQPAPAFKATAVHNGEFKEMSLADFKGKYLVLFFYPLDLWVFVSHMKNDGVKNTISLPLIQIYIEEFKKVEISSHHSVLVSVIGSVNILFLSVFATLQHLRVSDGDHLI